MSKIKIVATPNAGKDVEKLNDSHIAGQNVKRYRQPEKHFSGFSGTE